MSKTEELQVKLTENAESVLPFFKKLVEVKLGVEDVVVGSVQVLDTFGDGEGDSAAIVYIRAQRKKADVSGQPVEVRAIHQFGSCSSTEFEKTEVAYQSRMPELEDDISRRDPERAPIETADGAKADDDALDFLTRMESTETDSRKRPSRATDSEIRLMMMGVRSRK